MPVAHSSRWLSYSLSARALRVCRLHAALFLSTQSMLCAMNDTKASPDFGQQRGHYAWPAAGTMDAKIASVSLEEDSASAWPPTIGGFCGHRAGLFVVPASRGTFPVLDCAFAGLCWLRGGLCSYWSNCGVVCLVGSGDEVPAPPPVFSIHRKRSVRLASTSRFVVPGKLVLADCGHASINGHHCKLPANGSLLLTAPSTCTGSRA